VSDPGADAGAAGLARLAWKEAAVKDWAIIAVLALAAALVLHALFPRFDWAVERDGATVVVYDRWQGRFQRVVFQDDGTLKTSAVWTPF
jgi:hypothetical protein